MVSTRSRTAKDSSAVPAVSQPAKRAAATAAKTSPRPAKKAATGGEKMAKSDLAVGKPVTKELTLVNQEEEEVALADTFREQGAVFFMYPRANTPGCTKQACGFRDNIKAIKDAGFAVYGLSGDSPKALSNWKSKQSLPFDLLSDPKHELIEYFGSSLPGLKVMRSHVVVLKGGIVGEISGKVSPADSVSRAVAFVKKSSTATAAAAVVEKTVPAEEEPDAEKTGDAVATVAPLAINATPVLDVELETDASVKVRFQELFATRGAIFFMFPKADTPGCTIQSCGFNDNLEEIQAAGFDVYGLGGDTPAELLAWKQAQKYKYTFLSDPKHELISYFGSSINDGTRVERSHVILLPGGKVGQIEHKVSPQDSVSKALAFAKSHAVAAPDSKL